MSLSVTADVAVESRQLLLVVCVAFLAMGMAQASFGPALPDLARQSNAGLVAAGGALSAHFVGSLAGYTTAGLLFRRLGRRKSLLAGITAFVIGASGVAGSGSLPLLLASAACMGLGSATVALAGNLVAAELSADAGPLNLINAAFGLGAIASPALIGAAIASMGTGIPALWATPGAMAVAWIMAVVWGQRSDEQRSPARVSLQPHGASYALLRSPLLWTFCAFMFASVSAEVCIAGWLPTLLERAAAIPTAEGAVLLSWVWVLMTAMRLFAAWASRRVTPWTMLRACLTVGIAGGAALVACAATGSPILGLAGATLLGLALGPVMPTFFGMMSATFRGDAGLASGLMMGVGSIGAACVPWAMGALIVGVGPTAGSLVLCAMPIAMMLLLAAVDAQLRTRTALRAARRDTPTPSSVLPSLEEIR